MTDPATLGIAAAIALGVGVAVLAVLAVATRAREPHAAAATMDPGGDESPAVVNLMTNDWAVGKAAVPATLIDLAARKIVAFERTGPDQFVVRIPDRPPAELTSYEGRVYDHVRGLASGGVVPCEALMAIPRYLRAERETPQGLAVASRWLGLRAQLGGDDNFASQPPAGVAIWDRLLAYGAAMGVAPGAVRALPMGAESETHAWTAYGGRWRVVHVRYPRRFPPGWGCKPAVAIALGLVWIVPAAFVVSGLWSLITGTGDNVHKLFEGGGAALAALIALVVALAPLAAFAYGAAMFWSGASDLGKRMALEGQDRKCVV